MVWFYKKIYSLKEYRPTKEVLHLRWNERHLRAYIETLMTLLQT